MQYVLFDVRTERYLGKGTKLSSLLQTAKIFDDRVLEIRVGATVLIRVENGVTTYVHNVITIDLLKKSKLEEKQKSLPKSRVKSKPKEIEVEVEQGDAVQEDVAQEYEKPKLVIRRRSEVG